MRREGAAQPQPSSERKGRVALVIGVDDYQKVQPLTAAVYDATLVAEALEQSGFEVQLLVNPGQRDMDRAIGALRLRLETAEVGLVYYAGHGVQVDGKNYLVPADADLPHPELVAAETIEVDEDLILPMSVAGAPLNIVVLDACRNNPFARTWTGTSRALPSSGLEVVQAAPGFVIAYATAPDSVALDGGRAPDGKLEHGPYAEALAAEIEKPCSELRDVLPAVYQRVRAATDGKQVPWTSQAIGGERFYFQTPDEGEEACRSGSVLVVQAPRGEPIPWRMTGGILPGAAAVEAGRWELQGSIGVVRTPEEGISGVQNGWRSTALLAQAGWSPRPRLVMQVGGGAGLGNLPGKAMLFGKAWARYDLLSSPGARLALGALAFDVMSSGSYLGLAGPFLGGDFGGDRLRLDLTVPVPLWFSSGANFFTSGDRSEGGLLYGLSSFDWPLTPLAGAIQHCEAGARLRVSEDLMLRAGTLGTSSAFALSARLRRGRALWEADLGALRRGGVFLRIGALPAAP